MRRAVVAAAVGYLAGRTRPVRELVEWNEGRAVWHQGKHLSEVDAYLYCLLHPHRSLTRIFTWSPWYRKSEPPPTIDAADLLAK